jgi:frataxin-like iron-binding protein CyaY
MIIKQDIRPNKMIWVTFRKEGMHRYPAAATDPALATGDEYDVSFLANEHRHIFHFRVWIGVTHNDRDIEFIQFKRWLENLYKDAILSLDHKSCEMMSDDLYDIINKRYPDREIWIEVSEDGENGSFIKY